MKLLIVGASGLVGSSLLQVAGAQGHDVLGTRRNQDLPGLAPLDLADVGSCQRIIGEFQPDAVVCCAAWPWVDGCERDPERAMRENCHQPAILARIAAQAGARFVYISTSYVFDGEDGPYSEDAPTNPTSVYGRSKLDGENSVLDATAGNATIARTMGVYGEEILRKNFVYQVFDTLSVGKRMNVPIDQFGNATYSGDLARMLLALLENISSGIWNTAGPEPGLSRKDFALRIAGSYRLDPSLFDFMETKSLGQPARRPRQGGLRIEKITSDIGLHPSLWVRMDPRERASQLIPERQRSNVG